MPPTLPPDPSFFDRADAHIHLANEQCGSTDRGKVSASLMYANARFNAWVSACGFSSAEEMKQEKENISDYFVAQYRAMLEENLESYIRQFDTHIY